MIRGLRSALRGEQAQNGVPGNRAGGLSLEGETGEGVGRIRRFLSKSRRFIESRGF